jgi:hypothetical protein
MRSKAQRQTLHRRPQPPQPDQIPKSAHPSTNIPAAREGAIAIAATENEAMNALQNVGLQTAAAYIQRKTAERKVIVDKVSDAIAYLNDPGLLEADIMRAAAAKVQARSNPWGYVEVPVDLDNLFALPESQPLLSGI